MSEIVDKALSLRYMLKPLEPYLKEEGITEICVNKPGELWCERYGVWERHEVTELSFERLYHTGVALAKYSGTVFSETLPLLSAVLPDGERAQMVMPPACRSGTISLTVRRPSFEVWAMSDYVKSGFFDSALEQQESEECGAQLKALYAQYLRHSQGAYEGAQGGAWEGTGKADAGAGAGMGVATDAEAVAGAGINAAAEEESSAVSKLIGPKARGLDMSAGEVASAAAAELAGEGQTAGGDLAAGVAGAQFLAQAVRQGLNVVIAGETGSGKTTFMKTLMQEIPTTERLITIEDVPELMYGLPHHHNTVNLLYPSEGGDTATVTASSLMRSCLRMKPDRILLAELRGPETYDFLNVCLSGHGGTITSCHAGSVEGVFEYLALKVLQSPVGRQLPYEVIKRLLAQVLEVVVCVKRRGTKRVISELYFKGAAESDKAYLQAAAKCDKSQGAVATKVKGDKGNLQIGQSTPDQGPAPGGDKSCFANERAEGAGGCEILAA